MPFGPRRRRAVKAPYGRLLLDVGSHITNPRTGTEFRVMELGETRFVMRYTIPAGVGVPDIAEHYHHGWTEEFHVLEGHGHYRLDGRQHDIGAGESVTLPERVKHVHPWSSGDVQMVYDQIGTVENPSPNAVRETFGFFFTMFDWETRGKIKLDKVGLPKNPMLFALAGRVLGRAGGYAELRDPPAGLFQVLVRRRIADPETGREAEGPAEDHGHALVLQKRLGEGLVVSIVTPPGVVLPISPAMEG
jgi:quercetin dioxygenase-like cupin family protein